MDNEKITSDSIRKFFDNPFSQEYSHYCGESMISTFTQISAVLDYLFDLVPPNKKDEVQEVSNDLMYDLAKLLRVACISHILSKKELDSEVIEVDGIFQYISDIFDEKFEALHFTFNITSCSKSYIVTDPRVILELLLGAIRKMTLSHKGRQLTFNVGAVGGSGRVRIFIEDVTDPQQDEEGVFREEELFDTIFFEVSTVLAEIIGAETKFEDGVYSVEMKEYDLDNASMMNSPLELFSSTIDKYCEIILKDTKL